MYKLNDCSIEKIDDKSFAITAFSGANFFIDAFTLYKSCNAPFFYDLIDYDFIVSVKIEPVFKSTYDAGAILIFDDENYWIKAAFELTDLGYPSAVTVVTRKSSDDSNGEQVKKKAIWLRVLRKNAIWSIHYSLNNKDWKMVRYFEMPLNREVKVGVISQSPTGNGSRVIFTDFKVQKNNCRDMRQGK